MLEDPFVEASRSRRHKADVLQQFEQPVLNAHKTYFYIMVDVLLQFGQPALKAQKASSSLTHSQGAE
jgi:hypothetical protein